jgi:hypothetical protein
MRACLTSVGACIDAACVEETRTRGRHGRPVPRLDLCSVDAAVWIRGRGVNLLHFSLAGRTWIQHSRYTSAGDALAFRLLGPSIPFVVTRAGLRGLLETHQRFGLINAMRIPLGVFTFADPLLPFSRNVVPVVAVRVCGRVAAWVAQLWICLRVLSNPRGDLLGVMFPAFSASFVRDRDRTAVLDRRCVKYLF